jgi:hypothetical protein
MTLAMGATEFGVLSLAHVGEQRHEPSALYSVAGRTLEGCAVATPLAREHLALIGAKLLQEPDVFVVNVSRARAAFGSAEPAPILAIAAKLLSRHKPDVLHADFMARPSANRADPNMGRKLQI